MAVRRSIFEEVGDEAPKGAPVARTGMIERAGRGARGAIRLWLGLLAALVVAMILVGGLTRLTDSGLSITEWAPVGGAVPPMSAEAWASEFARYQQIPEFQIQNKDMTLEEFKGIYWWEWGHRQLGRAIGLVWAIGFVGFLVLRRIPSGWTGRLILPGVLGGVQGAIGWWMVSSGLGEGMLDVASYRLAIHLGLAFVILGLLWWYMLRLSRPERVLMQARRTREARLWALSGGLVALAFVQILLGALVAGIDAGVAFPTWPLMNGTVFPPSPFLLEPVWRNFFEDPGLVQFVHRSFGYLVFAFTAWLWARSRASAHPRSRRAFDWVLVLVFGQVVLGIVAVLTQAQLHSAISHLALAVILWTQILRARFLAGYPLASSVREGLRK
ncbi:MAG: heme A synthase [Tropicimonas sp.]|uniref:heme A synthase n=1 Tax=Tropicimonas sp. TaxID=2067044 RepID=UPI003A85CA4B